VFQCPPDSFLNYYCNQNPSILPIGTPLKQLGGGWNSALCSDGGIDCIECCYPCVSGGPAFCDQFGGCDTNSGYGEAYHTNCQGTHMHTEIPHGNPYDPLQCPATYDPPPDPSCDGAHGGHVSWPGHGTPPPLPPLNDDFSGGPGGFCWPTCYTNLKELGHPVTFSSSYFDWQGPDATCQYLPIQQPDFQVPIHPNWFWPWTTIPWHPDPPCPDHEIEGGSFSDGFGGRYKGFPTHNDCLPDPPQCMELGFEKYEFTFDSQCVGDPNGPYHPNAGGQPEAFSGVHPGKQISVEGVLPEDYEGHKLCPFTHAGGSMWPYSTGYPEEEIWGLTEMVETIIGQIISRFGPPQLPSGRINPYPENIWFSLGAIDSGDPVFPSSDPEEDWRCQKVIMEFIKQYDDAYGEEVTNHFFNPCSWGSSCVGGYCGTACDQCGDNGEDCGGGWPDPQDPTHDPCDWRHPHGESLEMIVPYRPLGQLPWGFRHGGSYMVGLISMLNSHWNRTHCNCAKEEEFNLTCTGCIMRSSGCSFCDDCGPLMPGGVLADWPANRCNCCTQESSHGCPLNPHYRSYCDWCPCAPDDCPVP